MKHVSSEEKAEILRAHGWVDNASGGWHRVSGDSDSGMGVSQAFSQLGHTTELERLTLFEYGWVLQDDETWSHESLKADMGFSGPMALATQAKLEAHLESGYQELILVTAENIAQDKKICDLYEAKRRMKS